MLQILGDLLPYAVPVALSPLPVIAVVMLLLAPAGTRGGLGFLAGRVATLAARRLRGGAARRPARGRAGRRRPRRLAPDRPRLPADRSARSWSGAAGRAASPRLPGWMRSLEGAARPARCGSARSLTVANPKELALVVGAGTIIGAVALPAGQALVAGG